MKEAEQCFPNKTEPNDALDLGDKNRRKKEEKLEIFDLFFFFLEKVILRMMDVKLYSILVLFVSEF